MGYIYKISTYGFIQHAPENFPDSRNEDSRAKVESLNLIFLDQVVLNGNNWNVYTEFKVVFFNSHLHTLSHPHLSFTLILEKRYSNFFCSVYRWANWGSVNVRPLFKITDSFTSRARTGVWISDWPRSSSLRPFFKHADFSSDWEYILGSNVSVEYFLVKLPMNMELLEVDVVFFDSKYSNRHKELGQFILVHYVETPCLR